MGTENNKLGVDYYQKEYAGIFKTVYGVDKAFANAMAPLQILDGVRDNAVAFTVKTNDTPVVIGEYKVDEDINSGESRFGKAQEVIYQDTDVPYSYTWAIHEVLDKFTVNNEGEKAVAQRLKLQAQAKTRKTNAQGGKYIAEEAGEELKVSEITQDVLKDLFNQAEEFYTDNEVVAPATVYLTPKLWTMYKELDKTSASTGFSTEFSVKKESTKYFPKGVKMLVVPDGVVIPFVGINEMRTMLSINHTGYNLQGAGKGGTFILDDNKKAIIRVVESGTRRGSRTPKKEEVVEEEVKEA